MQRIFLIGYMGAGKTIVGKNLAIRRKTEFIDIDQFIENRYKKSIADLFAAEGEEAFRKKEQKVLQEIIRLKNKIVLSTGGGTPCFFDNMKIMNEAGITVFLKIPSNILAERLNEIKQTRPLIKDKSAEEIRGFVAKNLLQREFFYNQASIIYSVSAKIEMDKIVGHLIQEIQTHQETI